MKTLVLLSLLIFSTFASAAQYVCTNRNKNRAELIIAKNAVYWNEAWHAASSKAIFIGTDKAPYSPRKNYSLFRLTSFYTTNDSSYILALEKLAGNTLKATVYFDNDDHEEEVTNYYCQLE